MKKYFSESKVSFRFYQYSNEVLPEGFCASKAKRRKAEIRKFENRKMSRASPSETFAIKS